MNRVNQIRVITKIFGSFGVFERNAVQVFTMAETAATVIVRLNIEHRGDEGIYTSGIYFFKVEVGNDKGWVTYDVDPNQDFSELCDSLNAAMNMHLGFYDEGETGKEDAA
jgi:hypothetical protein